MIRFHLDESVATAVADGLRRRGVDVTTSQDVGLLRSSDERQLEFAMKSGRTFVTHDADFLAIAKQGVAHSGMAYCHPESRSLSQVIAALMMIRDCLTAEDMRNHVEFL